jgi:LytS/YehU family sensor histidine kinase
MKDQLVAREFVKRFSMLYRALLDTSGHELVSLQVEMELVNNYLYLQKMRLGSRLDTHIRIDKGLQGLSVPPFSLQMMIENAIKHNGLPEEEKLNIRIYTEGHYVIVTNNLYRSHDRLPSTSMIGQKNIIERYRMIAGDLQPVFLDYKDNYTVRLPLLKLEEKMTRADYAVG